MTLRHRLLAPIRDRLVRAVADGQADLRRELLAELERNRAEVRDTRDQVIGVMRDIEHQQRNGIRRAASIRAVEETELFVAAHMPSVRRFNGRFDTLEHALGLVTLPGLALEFGVAGGATLRRTVAALPQHEIYGFDVFTGLPETWRSDFRAGMFAQDELPDVPGATLVAGLFADTLPGFLDQHAGPLAWLHLDADLYSSTATVLDLAGDRIVAGTVVLFDEYFNYPGWQDGEHRAWTEFVERSGLTFRWEGYTVNDQQAVLTVTGRP